MNKKVTIYLYILIAVFTLFVGGATYAFFGGNNNFNAMANLHAHTDSTYTFTSTSATDFNLNITTSDMSQSKIGDYVSSTLGTIDVNLTSPLNIITSCTFDLLFTWNSNDKYLESSLPLPYTHTDGNQFDYEFSIIVKDYDTGKVLFNERDLSQVNNGTGFTNNNGVYSGTIAEDLKLLTDNTNSKKYAVEARIYNLPINQSNLINKNMKATINVSNVNCQYGDESNIVPDEVPYLSTHYFEDIDGFEGYGIIYPLVYQGVEFDDLEEIKSIKFVNTSITVPPSDTTIATFRGMDNNVIKAWYSNKVIYIGGNSTIYPGPSMRKAFMGLSNLNLIDFSNANTSKVTDMESMFYGVGLSDNTFKLNLGDNFDTSNVTDMSHMFSSIGFSNFNFTLDLGNQFNTSKVTNMSYMFNAVGIYNNNFVLNLGSKFNTSKVEDMSGMFFLAGTGIEGNGITINLGNQFNTSNVTNMSNMFYEGHLLNFSLGNQFNTSKVKNMSSMFSYFNVGSNFTLGNNFNTANVTNMSAMFKNFSVPNLGNQFNTSNVTDMSGMFYFSSMRNFNLGNHFNTSKVTKMTHMFYYIYSDCIDLGKYFDTSNVTDMSSMFEGVGAILSNFTLNLGNEFNTSNVTNMANMFYYTGYDSTNFALKLGNEFNTSNVTNMANMFYYTGHSSSWTLNLKSFDFSKVGSNYGSFFSSRTSSNILTVLCSTANGDFINARVSGLTGYNVVCS